MTDILSELRAALEAACAERDRLWQEYTEASHRETAARIALHEAVLAAVRDEDETPCQN
jgi:hypothetical protein